MELTYHPACWESVADSMSGVSIQGFLILSCFASILQCIGDGELDQEPCKKLSAGPF